MGAKSGVSDDFMEYVLENGLKSLRAGGLAIQVHRIDGDRVSLRLYVEDQDERPIMYWGCDDMIREGETIHFWDLDHALTGRHRGSDIFIELEDD